MASLRICDICDHFITCHGTEYRYIACETCDPSGWDVCFDCYHTGRRCSGPDHELQLIVHSKIEHQRLPLAEIKDVDAVEAGCAQESDPILEFVNPDYLPDDWFRCLYFVDSESELDMLECIITSEEYQPTQKRQDLAVVHLPEFPPSGEKYGVLCNGELIELTEHLHGILKAIKPLPFKKIWILELCLPESLQNSPPIPLEAIGALAGRITNNHIYLDPMPSKFALINQASGIRVVRLVKFDRFGSPVLTSRELKLEDGQPFHIRILPEDRQLPATVFVNGVAGKASQTILNFLRTCICKTNLIKVSDKVDNRQYLRNIEEKSIDPTCPLHGNAEFFIPELCVDSTNAIETANISSIWSQIVDKAATNSNLTFARDLTYSPLDKQDIRLLRFFPARLGRKGEVDVPIATITCKLQEAPRFTALSYCWGSSDRNVPIPMLTGEKLKVTQPLGRLLQDLSALGITCVWIDQICIDQGNLDEKAVQVAKMLDIYKAADEVLIHLGPILLPQQVVHFVDRVAPRYSQQELSSFVFESNLAQEDKLSWAAFKQARSLPWFSRTWVVQEMSVNKNTSLLLGHERVRWDAFLTANSIVQEAFFFTIPADLVAINSLPTFAAIRKRLQKSGPYEAVDLLRVLSSTRFLDSSDPRDKIYAFLGLFDDASIKKWLPYPDYGVRVADVYTSFASVLALHGFTLVLLQMAGTSQTSQTLLRSLPSWVPDWSFGNALQRTLRACREFEHGQDGFASGTRFEMSAGPKTITFQGVGGAWGDKHGQDVAGRVAPLGDFFDRNKKRDDGLSMMDQIVLPMINHFSAGVSSDGSSDKSSVLVKAALFDQVIGLTKLRLFEEQLQTLRPIQPLQTPSEALLQMYEEARELLNLSTDLDDDRVHQLARTLIADTWRKKDSCDVTEIYRKWIKFLQDTAHGSANLEFEDRDLVLNYAGRVRQTLQDRVFGVTKSGRIGIFPATTEPGDHIGIVAGLDLPCVFRSCGKDFVFVGESYVDGVMYGEFEESEETKFRELKIV